MLRAVVILIIVVVIALALRWVFMTVRAYMRGELADGIGGGRPRKSERGWKVVQEEHGDTTIIRVEHRSDGVRRSWSIDMTQDGARRELVRARADAEALAGELNSN